MRLIVHDYAGHPFQIQLSRELARRGHIVVHAYAEGLLTPRGSLVRKPNDPETLKIVGVAVDANYRRDKYRFLRRRQMELAYGRKVASLIVSEKPDLVLSANTPTEPELEIARACRAARASFVPWIQDFYSVAVGKLLARKLPVAGHFAGWWYRRLERQVLRHAAAVVAITDDFAPLLREADVPPEKVVVIPNWAPLDELPQMPRRNAWSAENGLDDKFVFLYAGTLGMKHNPTLLVELARAFQDEPSVRVFVVSEGHGADFLRERKATERLDNFDVLPFQSFARMAEVLASADVLVAILEPDAGTFSVPSKVLTYHCAGRPLLAAIPLQNLAAQIISKEQTGLCVAPEDGDGFLGAARDLFLNEASRTAMSRAARAYAESHFDIVGIADRFERCFFDI